MENIKYVVFGVLAVVIIGLTVAWSAKHDEEVAKAAQAYEECTKAQIHMSVIAYLEKYGSYPVCMR